jgi:hypothetical protein
VTLGLYNGGLVTKLHEKVAVPAEDPAISDFVRLLDEHPFLRTLHRETRPVQVTVHQPWPASSLPQLVNELSAAIARSGLALKVIRSGHSVDVIPANVSKTIVVSDVMRAAGGQVMTIGDQGQVGGNDYELLDASPWSLSVDQCSGAPDRCWNVAPSGWRGPEALANYLTLLEFDGDSVSLTPR